MPALGPLPPEPKPRSLLHSRDSDTYPQSVTADPHMTVAAFSLPFLAPVPPNDAKRGTPAASASETAIASGDGICGEKGLRATVAAWPRRLSWRNVARLLSRSTRLQSKIIAQLQSMHSPSLRLLGPGCRPGLSVPARVGEGGGEGGWTRTRFQNCDATIIRVRAAAAGAGPSLPGPGRRRRRRPAAKAAGARVQGHTGRQPCAQTRSAAGPGPPSRLGPGAPPGP